MSDRVPTSDGVRVSVVIPTWNAGPAFGVLLDELRKQTRVPDEIIVVDSSSRDGTREIAAAAGCRVHRIEQHEFDHGGTRNVGARLASGDLVVMTVQDVLPADSQWLERLVAPLLGDDSIAAASSRQLARPGATVAERTARELVYPSKSFVRSLSDLGQVGLRGLMFSDAAAVYRRSALLEQGGFREGIIVAEDMEVAFRLLSAGHSIAYCADSCVVHSHHYGVAEQFQRNFDMGVFFATNPSVNAYASGAGGLRRFGMTLLKETLKHTPPRAWPKVLMDLFARAAGMSLGRRFHVVPRALRPKLSRARPYWKRAG